MRSPSRKFYIYSRGWLSDDYKVYFSLRNHTVVKFVNPNESLHSTLRDKLVKRSTKTEEFGDDEVFSSNSLVGEKINSRICRLITTLSRHSPFLCYLSKRKREDPWYLAPFYSVLVHSPSS
ncbi:hypothetical protein J5U23_01904 [Saccharolobus shibatae B12]|uniref:Uncharacterized protein n=1 Tax=Saccharolobus shibatae (strain ATCC 51178 / DSM 5389 / JCM 8931 / NBRC 15437 / B12) TaxID=523848 RepID=A0A8F5BPN2_SACSH|nr:hypothetical protein J5U23_01904 [Saccharolobus shibatae B12]